MSSFQAIIESCDAVILAASKLEEAKRTITTCEAEYRDLVARKAALETDVATLRAEKDNLDADIAKLNVKIFELSGAVAEKEDGEIRRAIIEPEPEHDGAMTPKHNRMMTPSVQTTAPSSSSSSTTTDGDGSGFGFDDDHHLPFQFDFDGEEIATKKWSPPSAALMSSDRKKRRASVAKRYSSPKKWRRMVRTHRLQSILLGEF